MQLTTFTDFLISGGPPAKGQAPSFVDKPVIRQGANSVIFECRCKATPQPTCIWYLETTVIKHGGRYVISATQEGEMWILILEIKVYPLNGYSLFFMCIIISIKEAYL